MSEQTRSCETCAHFNRQSPQYEFGFCQAPIPFWVFNELRHSAFSNVVNFEDGADCPAWVGKEEGEANAR